MCIGGFIAFHQKRQQVINSISLNSSEIYARTAFQPLEDADLAAFRRLRNFGACLMC